MIDILPLLCLAATVPVLIALCVIDLRVQLLPNALVLPLALLGIAFHASTHFLYAPPLDMLTGALIGGGFLYLIRMIANFYYKQDTLGLGDVKLMGAGGLWLGSEAILSALILGALAGLLHGILVILYRRITRRETGPLSTFSIPAGPGFIIGLVIMALVKFEGLLHIGL